MNKWVVVVIVVLVIFAGTIYSSSITGNSVWDWFGKKNLSPKRDILSDNVGLGGLVVSRSVDDFSISAGFKSSGDSLSELGLAKSASDSKMNSRFSASNLLTMTKKETSEDNLIIKKFTVKGGNDNG